MVESEYWDRLILFLKNQFFCDKKTEGEILKKIRFFDNNNKEKMFLICDLLHAVHENQQKSILKNCLDNALFSDVLITYNNDKNNVYLSSQSSKNSMKFFRFNEFFALIKKKRKK